MCVLLWRKNYIPFLIIFQRLIVKRSKTIFIAFLSRFHMMLVFLPVDRQGSKQGLGGLPEREPEGTGSAKLGHGLLCPAFFRVAGWHAGLPVRAAVPWCPPRPHTRAEAPTLGLWASARPHPLKICPFLPSWFQTRNVTLVRGSLAVFSSFSSRFLFCVNL